MVKSFAKRIRSYYGIGIEQQHISALRCANRSVIGFGKTLVDVVLYIANLGISSTQIGDAIIPRGIVYQIDTRIHTARCRQSGFHSLGGKVFYLVIDNNNGEQHLFGNQQVVILLSALYEQIFAAYEGIRTDGSLCIGHFFLVNAQTACSNELTRLAF